MYMCTVVREREENAGDEVAPFVATCHCVVPAYMHLPTTTVCTTVPLLLFICVLFLSLVGLIVLCDRFYLSVITPS